MFRKHQWILGRSGARLLAGLRRRLTLALLGPGVWGRLNEPLENAREVDRQLRELAAAVHPEKRAEDLQPLLAWIRGAEAHLAALQVDHEHLRESSRCQAAQLDRMTARAAALEARINDLERVDTEIVLAITRSRAAEQPR